MIVAIDAGNFETKFYDGNTFHKFSSAIGEYRDRNLKSDGGIEFEYNGQKGFAGTLALMESEFSESQKGETKAHPDARLRVLLALHQFAEGAEHSIVVGQPISMHTEPEKMAIKEMLLGRHEMTVNGKKKTIVIKRCEVAAEGVSVGLLVPGGGVVRVIDIGSGTINFGTVIDRKFSDKHSFTLGTGMETVRSTQPAAFARQIAIRALANGWKAGDVVYLCGGGAEVLLSHVKQFFTGAMLIDGPPEFANVRVFYMIVRKLYG
ncbi:plasmid segregation protein ParM [Paenibacillus sp. DS2015]|uniref:ParM/StbA family protein n=1 Tax=Paenibacillus sp. DS2015 TaxID=3373917 RepID=UPI003D1A0798